MEFALIEERFDYVLVVFRTYAEKIDEFNKSLVHCNYS